MPPARPPTRWDPDPADPEIGRWRENLRRGSVATGDAWYRALRRFCAETEHTTNDLLGLKPKALRDLYLDFAAADAKKGAKGSYTAYTLKVASNWLRFNGVTPPTGIKVRQADTVFEETALSHEQLRAALGAAGQREKVAILLMASSGVRPEVLGNFLGSDGLRIGDFPELDTTGRSIRFERLPGQVLVRQELSKAPHKYLTFVGEDVAGAIIDYLQARRSAGEHLAERSAIIAPKRVDLTKRAFCRTTKVGHAIRTSFRSAGLPNRPYVLRTTAASRFAEAENRGLVPHSYWQHWMGHSGDMSARYSLKRGRLPDSLIEEMREAYRRVEPLVSVSRMQVQPSEADLKRAILGVLLPESEIVKLDVSKMSAEDVRRLVTERLQGARGAVAGPNISTESVGHLGHPGQPTDGSGKGFSASVETVVRVSELKDRLASGWVYVTKLPNGEAIVRKPANGGGGTPPFDSGTHL